MYKGNTALACTCVLLAHACCTCARRGDARRRWLPAPRNFGAAPLVIDVPLAIYSDYTLDMAGATFGACKCGFPKTDHNQGLLRKQSATGLRRKQSAPAIGAGALAPGTVSRWQEERAKKNKGHIAEDKRKAPCRFHPKGTCNMGSQCPYSHAAAAALVASAAVTVVHASSRSAAATNAAPATEGPSSKAVKPAIKSGLQEAFSQLNKAVSWARKLVNRFIYSVMFLPQGLDWSSLGAHRPRQLGYSHGLLNLPEESQRRALNDARRLSKEVGTWDPSHHEPTYQCAPAVTLQNVASYLADTGSGKHLGNLRDLTPAEHSSMYWTNSIKLKTPNGITSTSDAIADHIAPLQHDVELTILPDTPNVLSVGKECIDHSFDFLWFGSRGLDPYFE